jgi:uncharacterized membrane protein YkvA (DUF1232 family)
VNKLKTIARPYIEQFNRSPVWVRILATLYIGYLVVPLDPFDILFPWMAFSDDLFIAGLLLKLLHKYGSLPNEDRTTPADLMKQIFKKLG